MSVKVHEAFSIDSFQDRLLWWDDFLGDQLKDEWNEAGTGSAAVVDAQTGGIVRLTTGALTGNLYQIDWNNIRSLHVTKRVTMETRVKLSDDDADIDGRIGLKFDASNWIMFYHDPANANIQIFCRNGGATTQDDSGVARDTSYHIYRVECFPTDEVHFYLDGVEVANSPITTNIPDDAGDYLQPELYLEAREDVAKLMDVDYIVLRQEI